MLISLYLHLFENLAVYGHKVPIKSSRFTYLSDLFAKMDISHSDCWYVLFLTFVIIAKRYIGRKGDV